MTGAKSRVDWVRWKEDWDDYAVVQDISLPGGLTTISVLCIALPWVPKGRRCYAAGLYPKHTNGRLMNPEKLETLMLMMKTTVMGELNDTYEGYVFRTRLQQKDEPFDAFLLDLRELKKTCDICNHMDEHVLKDQVIVGIQDDNLREKLLLERQLTLAKCIDMCRAAELASAQVTEITASSAGEVNRVTNNKTWKRGARSFGNSLKRENAAIVVGGM